jgi:hypothetical protein
MGREIEKKLIGGPMLAGASDEWTQGNEVLARGTADREQLTCGPIPN